MCLSSSNLVPETCKAPREHWYLVHEEMLGLASVKESAAAAAAVAAETTKKTITRKREEAKPVKT